MAPLCYLDYSAEVATAVWSWRQQSWGSAGWESPSRVQGHSCGRGLGDDPAEAGALLQDCTLILVSALTNFIGLVMWKRM